MFTFKANSSVHSPEQELAAIMTFKIIIVKNVHVYKFCTKKYYVLHLHTCTICGYFSSLYIQDISS